VDPLTTLIWAGVGLVSFIAIVWIVMLIVGIRMARSIKKDSQFNWDKFR